MNIVSWNVRGLERPSKCFLVKNFLQLHHADICCIQETKLSSIEPIIWRAVGGSRLDQFLFTPALGSAGGMTIGWSSILLEGHLLFQGSYCLSVKFHFKANDVSWVCTSIYGPNARHLKSDFWNKIITYHPGVGMSWVICGDFNSIFSHRDKSNGCPNIDDIRQAQLLIRDLHLFETPCFRKKFTWTNGQVDPIWVKLNRFLVNLDWTTLFPKSIQNCIPRLGLDHAPIRLESGNHPLIQRPFHFERSWCSVEQFPDLIRDWWNSSHYHGWWGLHHC